MLRSSRPCRSDLPPATARRLARATLEALEDRRLMSITLVTAAPGGGSSNGDSGVVDFRVASSVSDDGRFVAFVSKGTNLVANDTNGKADVFVRDLQAGTTTLVSATPAGASGNGDSGEATGANNNGFVISGNGRYVAFVSESSDLVANDNNGGADLFVRDLQTGQTTLVTINAAGTGSGLSPSGVTPENVYGQPAISDDGRWVAFSTDANDLVTGQENDSIEPDTFVRDLQNNVTTQLTKPAPGAPTGGGGSFTQSISADGRYVVFGGGTIIPGLGGVFHQVYAYDTTAQTTTLVSVAADGTSRGNFDSSEPRISADGRSVVFLSEATNLVSGFVDNTPGGGMPELFVRNLDTNTTLLASHATGGANVGGNGRTEVGSISANGRFVAFYSEASNLTTAPDTNETLDAFFFDAQSGAVTLLSINMSGQAANFGAASIEAGYEEAPQMSDDGRYVLFISPSADLVANDNNPLIDLFVRDTQANNTRRVLDPSNVPGGGQVFGTVQNAVISGNGSRIVFATSAAGGLPGNPDPLAGEQIYADDGAPTGPGPGPGPGDGTADLSGSIVTSLPSEVVGGEKAKVKVTVFVTNNGTGAASGPVTVKLFVSADGTLTGATEIASTTKNLKLKSLRSKAVKLKVASFPAVPDGTYSVIAQIDSAGALPESNEGNNIAPAAQPVTIAAPFVNLAPAAGQLPTALARGEKGTLSVVVQNLGNVIASGPLTVAATASPGGSPVTLGSITKGVKLKPGATKTLKLKLAVPDTLPAGPGGVFALEVDSAGAFAESDEADNRAEAPAPLTIT